MRTHLTAPWRYLMLVCSLWFGIFLLTRLVLLVTHLDEVHGDYFSLFLSGAVYDLSFLTYAALPLAVRAMQLGAANFVAKPWQNEQLLQSLMQALQHTATQSTPQAQTKHSAGMEIPLLGNSPAMQQVLLYGSGADEIEFVYEAETA